LQQVEQLPHLRRAADQLPERRLFRRRRVDDFFFGQVLDQRAADLELGAVADGDLFESRTLKKIQSGIAISCMN
jgi:hypothetical protein